MKNVIKKILSIAMAFVLLGTGITVTKTFSPKSDNTIVAVAANNCNHNCRWFETTYIRLTRCGQGEQYHAMYYAQKFREIRCSRCNSRCNVPDQILGSRWEFHSIKNFGKEVKIYENWNDFRGRYQDSMSNTINPSNYNTSSTKTVYSGNVKYKKDEVGGVIITEGAYKNDTFLPDSNKLYLMVGSSMTATFSNVKKIGNNLYSAKITVYS